jgi:2'-5' RNA ligase
MEQAVYDRLWSEAEPKIAAGQVQLDPYLSNGNDKRRGITLILRPSQEVRYRFADAVEQMAALEPEQYFYRLSELHITVLTLITAREDFDLDGVPLASYDQVFTRVCAESPPVRIRFNGVTASRGAVMAQGFAAEDGLNRLREKLRVSLTAAGRGDQLDTRYRATTAHVTLARFCAPLRDASRFVALLCELREQALYLETVDTVETALFVYNDWYMAEDVVRTLGSYRFSNLRAGP